MSRKSERFVSHGSDGGVLLRSLKLGDVLILTKARLSLMVVFTTAMGFFVGASENWSGLALAVSVIGTSLAAASAAVLNQLLEADVDRLMERTRTRPLPCGRVGGRQALGLGIALGLLGVGCLSFIVSWISGFLALCTIVIYLLMYTPLKRRSSACTFVGAVSGAIPPVIGWTCAGGRELWEALVLFGILFCWQIPHFLAIAWIYREEYQAAGFVMLKADDFSGVVTAITALSFSIILGIVSCVPIWFGRAGVAYGWAVGFLGLLLVGYSVVFLIERTRVSAKRLFLTSIVYLPALLVAVVLAWRA